MEPVPESMHTAPRGAGQILVDFSGRDRPGNEFWPWHIIIIISTVDIDIFYCVNQGTTRGKSFEARTGSINAQNLSAAAATALDFCPSVCLSFFLLVNNLL